MRLKSIIAFIPTRDADKSRDFYENTLGLRFVQDDGFAIVMDFKGTMVRIAKVGAFQPMPFTIFGFEVDDIKAAVTELAGRGGSVEQYSFLEQDELGIWAAPGGAKVAWFKDPDGNLLSLSQHPAPAKRTKTTKAAKATKNTKTKKSPSSSSRSS